MSTEVWIAIGIVFVIVWIAIIWEAWRSPIMPDDYGMEENDIDEKYRNIN